MGQIDLEVHRLRRTVRDDFSAGGRLAVDNYFHRNFSRVADARPLDVSVRFLIEPRMTDTFGLFGRLLFQSGGHIERDLHLPGTFEFKLADLARQARLAERDVVDLEIENVAAAVAAVAAPIADAQDPG